MISIRSWVFRFDSSSYENPSCLHAPRVQRENHLPIRLCRHEYDRTCHSSRGPDESIPNIQEATRIERRNPRPVPTHLRIDHRGRPDRFEIQEGELIGFLGPNGAGKTTTLKMLAGLLHPTAGSASVLGFTPWERPVEYRRQFALLLGQKNQLWWDLPARDSLELNARSMALGSANSSKPCTNWPKCSMPETNST